MLLLNRAAQFPLIQGTGDLLLEQSWQVEAGALDPHRTLFATSSLLQDERVVRPSTDMQDVLVGNTFEFDQVAGDVEEANVLFAGISNLITTRSDMFTVYFKIRSFRQNPTTGVWDALDREQIVDQSRYVMLVDRSTVESPTDTPRILYLEKLPN